MLELLKASLAPGNLVLTGLLLLCIIYWVMVIAGALGMDSLDVDLDGSAAVDGEMKVPVDVGGEMGGVLEGVRGAAVSVMKFLNFGEVPLMVLVTIALTLAWAVGVLSHVWVGGWAPYLQLLMLVPFLFAGFLAAKIITQPMKSVFRKFREQEEREQMFDLIGRRCRVVSGRADTTRGQVEVETEGAPLLLNARTTSADHVLKKGDEAVILAHDDRKNVYHIREF